MTGSCYVGCSPPTSIVTHAPVVGHLAFTGAGQGLEIVGLMGLLGGCTGLAFLAAVWMMERRK